MKRTQKIRRKKLPENTKSVTHPGKWGNHYNAAELGNEEAVNRYRKCLENPSMVYIYSGTDPNAEKIHNRFKWMGRNLGKIRGYDYLACFCSLDKPCHADVLIEALKGNSQC